MEYFHFDFSWWRLSDLTVEKDAFDVFLQRLKESFKDKDLLLTASLSGSLNFFSEKFDFSNFNKCFDFIHLFQLCFDEWCWSKYNIENAFNELKPASLEEKVDKLIEWGISAEKLILGVQFGGPYGSVKSGEDINTAKITDIYSYNSICKMQNGFKWHATPHDETKLHSLIANTNALEKIVYGESRTIANHMRFAVKRNLAGALGFLLEYDDFEGNCRSTLNQHVVFLDFIDKNSKVTLKFPERSEKDFPLLRTINDAIEVAEDEVKQLKKLEENPNETGAPPQNTNNGDPNNQGPNSVTSTGGGGNAPGSASNFTANSIFLALFLLGILLPTIFSL